MLDARWLDLLKANGLKLAAVSIACAILLGVNGNGSIPSLPAWAVQLLFVAMIVCGLLALASGASQSRHIYDEIAAWAQQRRALKHSIDTLNVEESEFLREQVRKGESTAQLNPFNAGGIRHFVNRAGMFQGLQNKGIVSVTAADPEGKIRTVTIEHTAWKLLKKRFAEQR